MTTFDWPHPHLPHALCDFAIGATEAQDRVSTLLPRVRTYPLLVIQSAGIGPIGSNSTIQADQPRVQVDAWAETKQEAEEVAGQLFRLWDKRFGGLQDTELITQDESAPSNFYRTKIERVERNAYTTFFDEIAQVWRATAFYLVKVNL